MAQAVSAWPSCERLLLGLLDLHVDAVVSCYWDTPPPPPPFCFFSSTLWILAKVPRSPALTEVVFTVSVAINCTNFLSLWWRMRAWVFVYVCADLRLPPWECNDAYKDGGEKRKKKKKVCWNCVNVCAQRPASLLPYMTSRVTWLSQPLLRTETVTSPHLFL